MGGGYPSLSVRPVVLEVARGLGPDGAGLEPGPAEPHPGAIMLPEPSTIAVVDPRDPLGRVEELAEVLPAPTPGHQAMTPEPMQVDERQATTGRAGRVEEVVAEIEVFVERLLGMEPRGDLGHLDDDLALQSGERGGIERLGEPG